MSEALDEIEQYRRDVLQRLLDQCTPEQQAFFLRMYPGGVEKIPQDKLDWATVQCENTIKKNRKKLQDENLPAFIHQEEVAVQRQIIEDGGISDKTAGRILGALEALDRASAESEKK